MAAAMSLTFCNITCITKFLFMLVHIKRIRITVEKFLNYDAKIVPGTRFSKNLSKFLRVVKKRALSIWLFLVTNGIVYIIIPFLKPGRNLTVNLYILYGLEPMLETPHYEIAHVVTTIAVVFCVYLMVNVAVYVIVMIGYNEAQINTLSEEVNNLWGDSQNFYNSLKHKIKDKKYSIYIKEIIVNEYIRIRLKDIINYHVTNIHFFHELNHEFSDTLAIEYVIMAMAIIAELLGGLEITYLQIPYTVVQLYMDCLSGQRLIDACRGFEEALYGCKWESFNASNQRTILLMLLISQKTLLLSAGGMANLNFECLMMIFKSSYSVYTALKSRLQH
ncbi:uncharacterized protein LOC112051848 [Bicyclus anynana]|uniref:Uncharacterized protein LOC112051848 n=1 Tax=Bicyclus anynana TaxID=110368 RepID=A0A6J1NF88_BICAN|nr:uncharacterized protein LOC112051848 [Bicyclus anynana]